jgi:predicted flap endonuclease-1-like 5' DNA nuclease
MGVGKVYGTKLREAGVKNTAQLLEETSTRYRRQQLAKETGIPYGNVLKLAQKVSLMKIDGVGVRQSNLLQAVGVETVVELARRDVKNLTERIGIANAFKPHFVDRTPSEATVDKWIEAAKKLAKKLEADE